MYGACRTWSSQRCPFPRQGVRTIWNLKSYPSQTIPQFSDSMIGVRDIQVQHLAWRGKLLFCNNLSSQIFQSGQSVTRMKMQHKWAQVFWWSAFYWKSANFSKWNVPWECVDSKRSRPNNKTCLCSYQLTHLLPSKKLFCLRQNTSRYQCRKSAIRFQVSRRRDPPGSQSGNAFPSAELLWLYFRIRKLVLGIIKTCYWISFICILVKQFSSFFKN